MGSINVNERKAIVAVVTIVALTILMLAERMDPATGGTGIVGIAMYIVGNGVAAATGKDVDPVVKRKRTAKTRQTDPIEEEE